MGRLQDLLSDFRLNVNIELKLNRLANQQEARALAEAVARLLAQMPSLPKLLVSSFSKAALLRFKELMPDMPLGVLARRLTDSVLTFAHAVQAASIHTASATTDAQTIKTIIDHGFEAYSFTINDPDRAVFLWQAGMSGLFTDYPLRFLNRCG